MKRLEERGCLEPGWSIDDHDRHYQLTELGNRLAREVATAAKVAPYKGRLWNTSVLLRVLLNLRFPASLSEEPNYLLMLAAAMVTEGAFEEAALVAARAADLRRNDPSVMFQAADRIRWFSVPAARDYIEHTKRLLAEQHPDGGFVFQADLVALEGQVAFDEGDRELGVRLLEKGHTLEPQNLFIARDLAEVYLEVGRRAEATNLVQAGLAADPGNAGLQRLLQRWQLT